MFDRLESWIRGRRLVADDEDDHLLVRRGRDETGAVASS
jgi:hypothetical protein